MLALLIGLLVLLRADGALRARGATRARPRRGRRSPRWRPAGRGRAARADHQPQVRRRQGRALRPRRRGPAAGDRAGDPRTPGDDLLELAEERRRPRRGRDRDGRRRRLAGAGRDRGRAPGRGPRLHPGRARATTSRSTSGSTATTWSVRSTPSPTGIERRIDLARVNDRVFVNNASLGVYAKVVQSPAYRDAKLRTWAKMLPGPARARTPSRSTSSSAGPTGSATATRRWCSSRTTPMS